ncbi:hypothetical protein SERLADRAFT_432447 [Serpula lacrymans var. lacrymans S7.9]|uniref:Uncharacterized protein n=1 Tax=Serpula lacrymans var. lacrymans (strain S7.9) TaxID=578457 RepID=F8NF98_SERL9|nr:uncharacterized protein SERLADRAFT_432447 [Serpula lacrymans var. lacrymans S7.9]EGO30812.1 hypothetical protein SERLADRAFT_432447 [Serpula lacrymans var. lacrymans S7.9]
MEEPLSLWATQMPSKPTQTPFMMDDAMDDAMDTIPTPCRIKTKFQHLAERNIAFPASHDRSENYWWTISERVLPCNAPAITDMQDLSAKWPTSKLALMGCQYSPAFLVMLNVSNVSTSPGGTDIGLRTLIKGYGAPIDVHPHELDITNKTQMIPYLSKEGSDNEQLDLNLQDAFADVFQWISDIMEFCLPEEYSMLAKIVNMLPGKPGFPVTPFLSLVVNINVSTTAHRDARKKAALASEAEAEKSATCKRVAKMLADEEDSEGDNLHGKKICLNGDDNDNNDNEDVADDDDNADDGKNMIDHILCPAEISSDDLDNSVVPPL